jgi:hypothetical protein
MPTEKKANRIDDVLPTSAEDVIATLKERGYETPQMYSFACAARSWCKKDSDDWLVWKRVEAMTSVSGSST